MLVLGAQASESIDVEQLLQVDERLNHPGDVDGQVHEGCNREDAASGVLAEGVILDPHWWRRRILDLADERGNTLLLWSERLGCEQRARRLVTPCVAAVRVLGVALRGDVAAAPELALVRAVGVRAVADVAAAPKRFDAVDVRMVAHGGAAGGGRHCPSRSTSSISMR